MNQAKITILHSYKGLSSMHFDSRFVCEFERDMSKDNRSFVMLSLSSTVCILYAHIYLQYIQKGKLHSTKLGGKNTTVDTDTCM